MFKSTLRMAAIECRCGTSNVVPVIGPPDMPRLMREFKCGACGQPVVMIDTKPRERVSTPAMDTAISHWIKETQNDRT